MKSVSFLLSKTSQTRAAEIESDNDRLLGPGARTYQKRSTDEAIRKN
jgi:hypothetical protein